MSLCVFAPLHRSIKKIAACKQMADYTSLSKLNAISINLLNKEPLKVLFADLAQHQKIRLHFLPLQQ
jgi:hypothetical protein